MQYRPIAALAAAALLAPASSFAAWSTLQDAPTLEETPRLIASGEAEAFTVDISVPGVHVIDDGDFVQVILPGHAKRMDAGAPELPVLSTSLLLPDSGMPRAELEVLEEKVLTLPKPLAPSRGHVTRDIPLSQVPRVEGPVYASEAPYPGEDFALEVGNPYILRDVRGVALRLVPAIYLPATRQLRILVKARVHVTVEASAISVNEIPARSGAVNADFLPLYQDLFLNAPSHPVLDIESEAGAGMILVPDQWQASMAPLVAWRHAKGMETRMVPMSDAGSTAAEIRTFVTTNHSDVSYLLLVGDSEFLPTLKGEKEGADCDACYAKLEGEDHVPDLFVSRFTAKTTAEVDVQVARAIRYEAQPVLGAAAAGYTKAVGIASNEGSPPDFTRVGYVRTSLLGWNYTHMDELYDEKGWFGKKVKPQQVKAAVEDGRSLIAYMGHGSKKAWVTSKFGVGHAKQLGNTEHWPMIWDVACVNGDFVGGSDSFAEAWAKAGTPDSPRGAIGMVAASTNMSWDPPVDWQAAVVQQYLIPGKAFTGGALHHFGLVKAMEKWGDDADSEGVMMVEQCIYFGDSSVQLRNAVPQEVAVEASFQAGTVRVLTPGEEPAPVAGARVVVERGEGRTVAWSDGAGVVSMPAAAADQGVTVTVTGPNLVPVLRQAIAPPPPPSDG